MTDKQRRLHGFVEFLMATVDIAKVMSRVEHAADLVLALDLMPVNTRIDDPGIRIAHHQRADGNVFSRILLGMMNDWHLRDIDVVARYHDLLDRRFSPPAEEPRNLMFGFVAN